MQKPHLVLVIDDDQEIVNLLRRSARQQALPLEFIHVPGYEGAVAYLDSLRGRGPQLVLVDMHLGGAHNGLDVLTLLRGHPQGRYLPVVMLSGDENPAWLEQAYRRGASAFTAKPEGLADWRAYVEILLHYWCRTVSVPRLWFEQDPVSQDQS